MTRWCTTVFFFLGFIFVSFVSLLERFAGHLVETVYVTRNVHEYVLDWGVGYFYVGMNKHAE